MASKNAGLVPHQIQKSFPAEIIYQIQSYLPQISRYLIHDLLRWKYTAKEQHSAAWAGIFKDEVWLSAITEMGYNPVLIGCDLDRYINSTANHISNKPTFLALVLGQDLYGGTKHDMTELRSSLFLSLQANEVVEGISEYFFPETGLTLQVQDAIHESHITDMTEPKKLLSRPLGGSSYLYWNDDEFKVRKIGRDKIIGVRKGRRKEISRVLGLGWEHLPDKIPRQHYFAKAGAMLNLEEIWGDSGLIGWTVKE
ncbi:hypothetical protein B0O99DRAFT_694589 [Bisporella sp. PMI_857]|nr:hypothetical protein B0O99DRAFT_694589 [Bisporella sp. PMI_857]